MWAGPSVQPGLAPSHAGEVIFGTRLERNKTLLFTAPERKRGFMLRSRLMIKNQIFTFFVKLARRQPEIRINASQRGLPHFNRLPSQVLAVEFEEIEDDQEMLALA